MFSRTMSWILTQRGAVFQHLPGLIGMIVDLDQLIIADHQQAVSLEVLHKIVVNDILIQASALDEQLGIKLVFDHGNASLL